MIVILTDSTAYLTKQEAKDLKVVYMPMNYIVNDAAYSEQHVDAYRNINKESFAHAELKTAQPGMSVIMHRMARLRAANCEVLCLTISSRLSGTYSNAVVCAKKLGNKGIRVVDTLHSAGGIILLIREARRLIDSGKTLDETADAILAMREHVHNRFSVRDLTPLRRSGRLGFVRQSVGTILNQRPILECSEGSVICCDMARGANEQLKKLLECVPVTAKEVAVQCVADNKTAKRLAEILQVRCERPVAIRQVGPVLAIHLGFDVIGVVWIDKKKA